VVAAGDGHYRLSSGLLRGKEQINAGKEKSAPIRCPCSGGNENGESKMSVYSGTNHISKILYITIVLCATASLVDLTFAGDVTNVPGKLTFTANEDGGYEFDTGVLRGRLRQAGKCLGLSSTMYAPTGTTLNGAYGILSYYRVFTTNKRYGTAAWDWPNTSKLLSNGAVQVTWPEAEDRPFEMSAIYRFRDSSTLDVETIVKAGKDLNKFEVFLASYFHESFPIPQVYVAAGNQTEGKPAFLTAKKSLGDWQMFPRNEDVLPIIRDGRWQKEPNPVDWKIMSRMAMPIALRRGPEAAPTAILMAPPEDCFAISTPYEGEGHYSVYFSLFGRDITAGHVSRARLRFVIKKTASEQEILDLYQKYIKEVEDGTI
jgi:hypothetical protein